MANVKKTNQVDELSANLKSHPNFVLIKFDKTTHQNLETLRKELKKNNSQFKVVKNNLFEKATNKLSSANKTFFDLRKKFFPLKETTALLIFKNDWSKGLNAFHQFMQKEKTLSFKLAVLENQVYGTEEVTKIAQLPPKEQLMAQIIRSMKSPMANVVYSMKYNLNKFVYILDQKSKKS